MYTKRKNLKKKIEIVKFFNLRAFIFIPQVDAFKRIRTNDIRAWFV